MKNLIEAISHRPFGNEHPYHQDPDERFPRHPLAGQPVSLGVRTFPPGAAARVWATWTTADAEGSAMGVLAAKGGTEAETMQFAASTIRLGDTRPGDTWRIDLPAFARGEELRYRVHAVPEGSVPPQDQVDSPVHSFTVLGWISSGSVSDYQLDPTGLHIRFSSSDPEITTVLQVRVAREDQLSFGIRCYDSENPPVGAEGPAGPTWQIREKTPERLALTSGSLSLELSLAPFRLTVGRSGKTLLITGTSPEWLAGAPGGGPKSVRLAFDSPADEGFYGLGERYHQLNLRGSALATSVYEQYKNQGVHTYIPVPFFLSSAGYGFYLATARSATFDLAASRPDRWQYEAELGSEAAVSFQLFAGASPRENLRSFSRQVGLPSLPPDWAFGHWMSSNEWNSQAIVMEQARLSRIHDIPATVIVIEAWADEKTFYIWNDARYEPKSADQPPTLADFTFPADGLWPNPKEMIDELHRQGIRVVLWQIPVLKNLGAEHHAQHDNDEAYLLEKNYCLWWPDGSPYRVRPFWFHGSLLLDFSNPAAVDWWMSKRAYLLDELNIDGFKTDGGEHLWGRDVVFANGLRGDEGLNLYPNLYVGAYYRFANDRRNGNALTFSRAGFTGAQAFPCHWAGDENSTWEAFRASLMAGISAGLSGIPFWGWDLAGFSGEIPSAELYLRAAGMAAFCPIMQFHSEFNDHRRPLRDRTPWNIAERTGQPEVIDIYRRFVKTRLSLLPYIIAEARHCAETGEPLMRALFLDWPDDPQTWKIADQYCFGRDLLVAPVLAPEAQERHLYLPAGRWEDFWSGTQYAGQQWITVGSPLDLIPVFRRLDQGGVI